MKAVQISKRGGPLEIVERERPEPLHGMVRLRVVASGVCHGEVMAIQGHHPGVQYPRIPGHEVVGIIDALGEGVEGWKAGDRVGVGWSGGGRRVTGLTQDGGYAEWMLAYAEALVAIPGSFDSAEVAPLLCAGVTTYSALRSMKAGPGDVVAIQGVGGLGHLAIQFAQRFGFDTVALSRGSHKEALARALGAREYYDMHDAASVSALKKRRGIKAILATAPSAKAIGELVDMIGPEGELVIVAGEGSTFELSPAALLNGRRTIRGWTARGTGDLEQTLRFSEMAGIKPMIERFSLTKAPEAFEHMMSARVRFRSVLIPD